MVPESKEFKIALSKVEVTLFDNHLEYKVYSKGPEGVGMIYGTFIVLIATLIPLLLDKYLLYRLLDPNSRIYIDFLTRDILTFLGFILGFFILILLAALPDYLYLKDNPIELLYIYAIGVSENIPEELITQPEINYYTISYIGTLISADDELFSRLNDWSPTKLEIKRRYTRNYWMEQEFSESYQQAVRNSNFGRVTIKKLPVFVTNEGEAIPFIPFKTYHEKKTPNAFNSNELVDRFDWMNLKQVIFKKFPTIREQSSKYTLLENDLGYINAMT